MRKVLSCPLLVFQMGKVGSKAVAATLAQKSLALVLQYHSMGMLTRCQRFVVQSRCILRLPIKIISPIRDPVTRNFSAFFENFTRDTGLSYVQMPSDLGRLRALFLDHYPHHVGVEWFDRHMRPAFGVNVYSTDFPRTIGWKIYRKDRLELLVYRTDLERRIQLDLLAKFTGLTLDSWVSANEAEGKDYAEIYLRASRELRLPPAYISSMLSTKYCRHFWTPTEIAAMKARWEEPAGAAHPTIGGDH